MRHLRILALAAGLTVMGGLVPSLVPGSAVAAQNRAPSQPAAQNEFVPIDELPPQEQVPAAPMVVAAYSFIWIALLAYVFSLIRRIKKVESDLAALENPRR